MNEFMLEQERWALVNAETGKVALVGGRSLIESQAAALDGYEPMLEVAG